MNVVYFDSPYIYILFYFMFLFYFFIILFFSPFGTDTNMQKASPKIPGTTISLRFPTTSQYEILE